MKKLVTVVLVLLLLSSSAFAIEDYRSKSPRNVFEFVYLYSERFAQICDICDANPDQYKFFSVYDMRTGSTLSFPGGTVFFSPETYEITSWMGTAYDVNASDEENQISLMSAWAAFSALEYGVSDESMYDMYRILDTSLKSTILDQTQEVFFNQVASVLTDEEAVQNLLNGNDTDELYSGNYSYSAVTVQIDQTEGARPNICFQASFA